MHHSTSVKKTYSANLSADILPRFGFEGEKAQSLDEPCRGQLNVLDNRIIVLRLVDPVEIGHIRWARRNSHNC